MMKTVEIGGIIKSFGPGGSGGRLGDISSQNKSSVIITQPIF